MNYQPEIAVVEANTLTCLGLKGILEEMILCNHTDFSSLQRTDGRYSDMYAHYSFPHRFTWSTMLSFSPETKNDCIGKRQSAIPTVRRTCTQHSRIRRRVGEKHIETSPTCSPWRLSGKDMPPMPPMQPHQEILSAREIESARTW